MEITSYTEVLDSTATKIATAIAGKGISSGSDYSKESTSPVFTIPHNTYYEGAVIHWTDGNTYTASGHNWWGTGLGPDYALWHNGGKKADRSENRQSASSKTISSQYHSIFNGYTPPDKNTIYNDLVKFINYKNIININETVTKAGLLSLLAALNFFITKALTKTPHDKNNNIDITYKYPSNSVLDSYKPFISKTDNKTIIQKTTFDNIYSDLKNTVSITLDTSRNLDISASTSFTSCSCSSSSCSSSSCSSSCSSSSSSSSSSSGFIMYLI